MRREIKFRAWLHDAESMIYSDSHKIEDSEYWWETNPFRVGCVTGSTGGNQFEPPGPIVTYYENLMQYTGLKDKNGVEIYEGDIVNARRGKMKVIYFNAYASFILEFDGLLYPLNEGADIEVIGNIYENPDFLNNQK